MTQSDLARMTRTSKSTISRVETCQGNIPASLPQVLDQVMRTDGKFKSLYEEVNAQSFPEQYRQRIELESRAVSLAEWSPTVVPGLLQTPDYAWALFREGDPRAGEHELSSKVESRINRQRVLTGASPPDFSVIVCESVILRRVGSAECMRGQLRALLEHSTRRTTVLQVLPLTAGTHGLMDGPISLLTSPEGTTAVYTEGIRSGAVIGELPVVRQLARSYDVITATALSREASVRLIRKQLEAL